MRDFDFVVHYWSFFTQSGEVSFTAVWWSSWTMRVFHFMWYTAWCYESTRFWLGGVDFWRFSIRPGGGGGSMCGGIVLDDGCMLVHSPEACFLIPQEASQTLCALSRLKRTTMRQNICLRKIFVGKTGMCITSSTSSGGWSRWWIRHLKWLEISFSAPDLVHILIWTHYCEI